jgi:hypothetical protein
MRSWALLIAATLALAGRGADAQDFELELTEDGLNRLIDQLGDVSSAGIHQPNPLGGLGYRDCSAVGLLDCSGGAAATAPGADAQSHGRVLLNRCQGPDGESAIVPGAESIPWQWWITQARFTLAAQQLSFSASVRYRVDRQWSREERTVPATLRLDVASQRLRLEVSTFKVPLRYSANGLGEAITEVDVGRHLSFAIPINAQTIQVPGLDGGLKTVTGRAQSAILEYLSGKVRVKFDATFN